MLSVMWSGEWKLRCCEVCFTFCLRLFSPDLVLGNKPQTVFKTQFAETVVELLGRFLFLLQTVFCS